jgi:cell division protein FtsL
MSEEILYIIMITCGVGSILALGYAQYHLYKAQKHFDTAQKHLNDAQKHFDTASKALKSYKSKQR